MELIDLTLLAQESYLGRNAHLARTSVYPCANGHFRLRVGLHSAHSAMLRRILFHGNLLIDWSFAIACIVQWMSTSQCNSLFFPERVVGYSGRRSLLWRYMSGQSIFTRTWSLPTGLFLTSLFRPTISTTVFRRHPFSCAAGLLPLLRIMNARQICGNENSKNV